MTAGVKLYHSRYASVNNVETELSSEDRCMTKHYINNSKVV